MNKRMKKKEEVLCTKLLYWIPRVLALAFVGFISLFSLDIFGVYSGFELVVGLFIHLVPSIVLLLVIFVAWKNEFVGGFIFLFLAIAYVLSVGLDRHWSWYVGISGPLLLLSILFFMGGAIGKKRRTGHK